MRARRVAVLSDVHGNAVALEAVLRELQAADPDLVVFGGDLTWGPQPAATLRLVSALDRPTIFVRGNAERGLLEAADRAASGDAESLSPRERWLVERHAGDALAVVRTFVVGASVEIAGLGSVRFCHGSPRSDEEVITDATPAARMAALLTGVDETVLVSAHTHLQFDRVIAGVRSVNPGSVGMPYEGAAGVGGAYWALLGRDVDLRRAAYDVEEAVRRYRASDDPLAEQMVELLLEPPTREEVVADGEAREFAG